MSTLPKVSIGIPTWNRCDYLAKTLSTALAQTYPNIEIVVSDNESTDNTWDYLSGVSDVRVRPIRQQKNIGMVGNFNAVLHEAMGDYFLLLSDDDLLEPTAIEKLMGPFLGSTQEASPESLGMTWCPCKIIDADGKILWRTDGGPAIESSTSLLLGLFNGTRGPRLCSILMRRLEAISLGSYNAERHGLLCDTGMWGRVALLYDNVACIDEPLSQYRVHAASGTRAADCAEWQSCCKNIHEDYITILRNREKAVGENQLRQGMKNHLANVTVTVLMQYKGKPGWLKLFAAEFWRSRRFMLTPFVAKRILKDGWKLLRLK